MKEQNLSKSFEDYLETIYVLKNNKKVVRIKDIANNLSVSLPSVNMAIKKLDDKNLVVYEKYGFVQLTENGEKIAKEVYKKHKALLEFFTDFLKVNEKTALQDACIMEHGLSKPTLLKLEKFIKKLKGGKK